MLLCMIRQVVLEHVQYENCIDLQMTWEARGSSLKFCQIFDKLCQNGPVDPISFFGIRICNLAKAVSDFLRL